MEYVIGAVILAVIVYILTRKKKEKPPIEQPIAKEEKKEVIVKNVPTEEKVYWVKNDKKEWGKIKYMPAGLQVFDENGECMLDLTDKLTRIIEIIPKQKNTHNTEKTKQYSLERGQKMWVAFSCKDDYGDEDFTITPKCDFSGSRASAYVKYISETQAILYYRENEHSSIIVGVV